jgi:hypothetical protein
VVKPIARREAHGQKALCCILGEVSRRPGTNVVSCASATRGARVRESRLALGVGLSVVVARHEGKLGTV